MGDSSNDKGEGLLRGVLTKILQNGPRSRTYLALQANPDGLTLAEIADITGLSIETVQRSSARELFNLQVAEHSGGSRSERVYKLKRASPVDLDCKSGSVGVINK